MLQAALSRGKRCESEVRAAVYEERFTSDVARGIRQEKHGRIGDVIRATGNIERCRLCDIGFQPLILLGVHLVLEPACADKTGTDRIDPDRRGEGAGERSGEPISLYVTVRTSEPITDLKMMGQQVDELSRRGRSLGDSLAIPNLLVPLRDEIASGSL